MLILLALLLIVVGFLALALQRFYSSIPAKELKRLAAQGDHLAEALYRPVSFGRSMRLLLWIVAVLATTGGVLAIINKLPALVAFGATAVVLGALFLLQSIRLTVKSARVAVHAAPVLHWMLTYLHRPLDFAARSINSFRTHAAHSGLYEKEDLVALLRQQKEQVDNRISHHDLELLERAAQFDERQAADIVIPMSRAKLVKADDHIGPILLGELHNSGQNSFLVYEDTPDHVVGTLLLRDAVAAKEGGAVSDLMHHRLSFVHEDFSLRQVLKAFSHTGQFMVVVINAFEEPVGVITMQQLLTQLVGEHADDDFDRYEDRAAVAAFKPLELQLAEAPAAEEEPEAPSPEPTEVIESER